MQEKNKRPEDIVKYVQRVKEDLNPYKYESYSGSSSPQEPNQLPKELQFSKLLPLPKSKKMSATRSWQIIKQSMSKDELEDHYKRHPEDRPIKVTPYKLDDGLTQMLGDDWWKGGI